MNNTFSTIIQSIPEILVWIFGVILAVRMRNNDKASAENLLLTGCGLLLVRAIIQPVSAILTSSIFAETSETIIDIATKNAVMGATGAAIGLVGVICLIIAFKRRFLQGTGG